VTDNLSESRTGGFRAWFLLSGPGGSHAPGKTMGRADKKMAGADGKVANSQAQESLLGE
jgi:hypothetical protein